MAILRERGVIRNFLLETETCEPAPGNVLLAAMKLAQAPIYTLPNGNAKQGMSWVTNLGADGPALFPEVLRNGGTVGFGTVIMTNSMEDLVIFIAVNQNESKPSPIALQIGRSLEVAAS